MDQFQKKVIHLAYSKPELRPHLLPLLKQSSRKEAIQMPPIQHGLSVGDILYSSWGYDQTNVDFYEVTKVMSKQVMIRQIAQNVVKREGSTEYVVPVPGRFIGEAERKTPRGSGTSLTVKLNSYCLATLWDGKPKYQTRTGWGH